jgi:hypothetical protein
LPGDSRQDFRCVFGTLDEVKKHVSGWFNGRNAIFRFPSLSQITQVRSFILHDEVFFVWAGPLSDAQHLPSVCEMQ